MLEHGAAETLPHREKADPFCAGRCICVRLPLLQLHLADLPHLALSLEGWLCGRGGERVRGLALREAQRLLEEVKRVIVIQDLKLAKASKIITAGS